MNFMVHKDDLCHLLGHRCHFKPTSRISYKCECGAWVAFFAGSKVRFQVDLR